MQGSAACHRLGIVMPTQHRRLHLRDSVRTKRRGVSHAKQTR